MFSQKYAETVSGSGISTASGEHFSGSGPIGTA